MLFCIGERRLDHLIKLEQLFATKFSFGHGELNEKELQKFQNQNILEII